MSNSLSVISEIVTELKNRGYKAEQQGNGVFFDVNPDLGECLSYAVELVSGKWQVNVTKVAFDSSGDDNEEQYILGDYDTATEIADAIDEDDQES